MKTLFWLRPNGGTGDWFMHGDTEECAVGDENAGVADLELPSDTETFDETISSIEIRSRTIYNC